VQLTGWSMSGQNHSTSARITPERTFEIGGLRAGMNYFIALDVPSFVPLADMDLKGREGQRIDKVLELRLGARVRGIVDAARRLARGRRRGVGRDRRGAQPDELDEQRHGP
jgi:hypothetical protein